MYDFLIYHGLQPISIQDSNHPFYNYDFVMGYIAQDWFGGSQVAVTTLSIVLMSSFTIMDVN